jgi:zinc-binding alcohol dehydrogenase/oxidoreductase
MRAVILRKPGANPLLSLEEVAMPTPGPGEVIVQLRAAALNRRDLSVVEGARPGGKLPFIPGSDGSGVVFALGDGTTGWRAGDPVVINPALSCGTCTYCLSGEQSLCDRFEILGGPSDGTFAEYVRVPAANLASKPDHLDFTRAAALPLSVATAWRALMTRGRLQPGETVLIHGIGGGVALYALQIALAAGARALVTSSQAWKLERAAAMGATAGIDYSREDVAARVMDVTAGKGADLVVDSGGRLTLPVSLAAAAKGGRIVHFGATTGVESLLNTRQLYWKQVSLIGTTMNSQADFERALRFVSGTGLVPVVSGLYPLAQFSTALSEMEQGRQFGKLVVQCGDEANHGN